MKFDRRSLCRQGLATAAFLALGPTACRRKLGRGELLAALVLEVARPDTESVVAVSAELSTALAAFTDGPSDATLKAARNVFRTALVAWRRAQVFRFGPLLDTSALLRAAYWPTRPALIEEALASSAELDDRFVGELGVDGRGLFALEYLLFPLETADAEVVARFAGNRSRRGKLVAALGRNVKSYADAAGRAFGDGQAFSKQFSEAASENLAKLVGELISNLENLAIQRLALPLELAASGMMKPAMVEGWPSGTSYAIARAQLLGNHSLFQGGKSGGLLDLVRVTAPKIAERVEERFANAIAKLEAVNMPLERAAREKRVQLGVAASAAKALEVTLKVDLTAALGITLVFAAGDGD